MVRNLFLTSSSLPPFEQPKRTDNYEEHTDANHEYLEGCSFGIFVHGRAIPAMTHRMRLIPTAIRHPRKNIFPLSSIVYASLDIKIGRYDT
jgi:hypothetical protein